MSTPSRLWSNTRYVVWLISDTAKELAGALATFALPLITLAVTGEPTQAGIIGAISTVVILIASLYGGVLADRHDRARLMVLGAAIGLALAAGLTALILTDSLSFAVLLAAEVVLAAQFGLFSVAGEAILKDIVPADALGRAQAANQARDAVVRLTATPLGGVLLTVGAWLIGLGMLFTSLLSMLTSIVLRRMADADRELSSPRTPDDAASGSPASGLAAHDAPALSSQPSARRHAGAELWEGVMWLMRRRDLRPALFVMILVNLGYNASVTTVIYSLQQRGESPTVIGLLGAALGATSLLGALLATPLVTRVHGGVLTLISLTLSALAMGVLPFTDLAPVMILAPALGVLLTPALNASRLGYSMVAIPTELMGRVRSAMTVIVSAAMPLAPLVAGVGLSTIGASWTFAIGAGCCVITVVLALCTPALRDLPAEAGWTEFAKRYEQDELTAA